jgi:lipoprotein-anchoring transpeptidase ErfK/SrfK
MGALALLASLALPASASAETGTPAGGASVDGGGDLARWAHPVQAAAIRRRPSQQARRVAWTHLLTEDGYAEVYPVMHSVVRQRVTWVQIRVPGRPNGRTGWVRAWALGPIYRVATRLVVERGRLRATLYRSGRRVWRSPIGVGQDSTPTPGGRYWIREKFKVADAGGLYGPRAFGTSAYSVLSEWPGGGVIGIHGTNEPQLIPGRPSHGCIRVPNEAIERLYRLMPIGTPVEIR